MATNADEGPIEIVIDDDGDSASSKDRAGDGDTEDKYTSSPATVSQSLPLLLHWTLLPASACAQSSHMQLIGYLVVDSGGECSSSQTVTNFK